MKLVALLALVPSLLAAQQGGTTHTLHGGESLTVHAAYPDTVYDAVTDTLYVTAHDTLYDTVTVATTDSLYCHRTPCPPQPWSADPNPPTGGGGTAGIPYGHFREPDFGPLRTGGYVVLPQHGLDDLATAKAQGGQVFLNPIGSGACAIGEDGRFQVALWIECFDRLAWANIRNRDGVTGYGDDGTILAIYVLDEPNHPTRWGPAGTVTREMVEAIAAHSEARFPRIRTAVRAAPTWLEGRTYVALDIAWAQYAARRGPVVPYRDQQIASAKRVGLALVFGLNAYHGGSVDPEDPLFEGFMPDRHLYAMGPKALKAYGEALMGGGCAFLLWEYRENYSTHPSISPVLDDLGRLAAQQPARPCKRG